MSEELAFKILKQADIDYGCDNCPRTDKNKSCIGCLDKSKEILIKSYEKLQQENKQLKSILTDLEEWLKEEIENIKNNYSQVNGNYFNMNYKIETYEETLDKIQELKEKYK